MLKLCFLLLILLLISDVASEDCNANFPRTTRPDFIFEKCTLNSLNRTRDVCKNITMCVHKQDFLSVTDLDNFKDGLFIRILDAMLRVCCGPCITVDVVRASDSYDDIHSLASTANEACSIYGPLTSTVGSKYGMSMYLPLLKNMKPIIVRRKRSEFEYIINTVRAIAELWPIYVFTIVLCIVSGFIVWILDTWNKNSPFPNYVPIGVFEGFWWSIVTLATVGYGDRVPASIPGKIYGMIWMFISITFVSVLTANITSSIDRFAVERSDISSILNLGIWKGSLVSLLNAENSKVETKVFESMQVLIDNLQNQKIEAALIMDYEVKFAIGRKKIPNMETLDMVQTDSMFSTSYGVAIPSINLYELLNSLYVNDDIGVMFWMRRMEENITRLKDSEFLGYMTPFIKTTTFLGVLPSIGSVIICFLIILVLFFVYKITKNKKLEKLFNKNYRLQSIPVLTEH